MSDQYGVLYDIIGWNIVRTDGDLDTEVIARVPDYPSTHEGKARARRIAHLLSLYGLVDSPIPDSIDGAV